MGVHWILSLKGEEEETGLGTKVHLDIYFL